MIDAKEVQRKLRANGRYTGAIDGIFGVGSWAALLATVAGRRVPTEQDRTIARGLIKGTVETGIDTPLEIAHLLAQLAVESGGFARLVENLSYSAPRLCAVWPSRFPNAAAAAPYARNPEALANKVYGGRLGNTEPGDGWRYRGRGLIQLTGKANYAERERDVGLPLVAKPELAADPDQSAIIACRYWKSRKLQIAALRDDLPGVRRGVNGGTHGLSDARVFLQRAKAVLL